MKVLINQHKVVEPDTWIRPKDFSPSTITKQKVLVPYAEWVKHSAELKTAHQVGIILPSDIVIEEVSYNFNQFTLIALQFDSFTDGRHFSTARLLRERYAYKGEIRAIGDVAVDQVVYLQRCGFNSYEVQAEDQTMTLKKLANSTAYYQAAADELRPLYRRRGLS